MACQNLWDATKTVLRMKLVPKKCIYIEKIERHQRNNVTS